MAGEEVSLSDFAVELPPPIQKFLTDLESDRKKLMKDQAYSQGAQLQVFLGTFLYPRLIEALRVLSAATFDVYSVSVTNGNNVYALRSYVRDRLRELGVDDGATVSREATDEFQQVFFALGTLLGRKLPDDKETQAAYNKCAEILGAMVAELTGGFDDEYDDDYDDDPDDDAPDDGDDDSLQEASTDGDESAGESDAVATEPEPQTSDEAPADSSATPGE